MSYVPQPVEPQKKPSYGKGMSETTRWIILGAGFCVFAFVFAIVCGGSFLWLTGDSEEDDPEEVVVEPNPDDGRFSGEGPIGFSSVDEAAAKLASGSTEERSAAAMYFATVQPDPAIQKSVVSGLNAALLEKDSAPAALDALQIWGDASSTDNLAAALQAKRVRALPAIKLLGKFPDPNHAAVVTPFLEARQLEAEAAKETLANMGPDAAPDVRKVLRSRNGEAVEMARELLNKADQSGDDEVYAIRISQVQSEDPYRAGAAARWFAAQKVVPNRLQEVSQALDIALQNEDSEVRELALKALLVWADRSVAPRVMGLLLTEPSQASVCLRILGKLKYAPAARECVRRLAQPGQGEAATESLLSIGPSAREEVAPMFNHPQPQARQRARRVLKAYKTTNDQLFAIVLEDLKRPQQISVPAAIDWLMSNEIKKGQKQQASQLLMDLANHKDKEVAGVAILALIRWQHQPVTGPLTKYLATSEDRDWAMALVRKTGANGETILVELLEAEDNSVVVAACQLLGDIGGNGSEKALKAVAEGSTAAATAADEAIAKIRARTS